MTKVSVDIATTILNCDDQIIQELHDKQRLKYADLEKTIYHSMFNAIAVALNSTNPRQILYHVVIRTLDIPICKCGANLNWHLDNRAYRQYCGVKCSTKFSVEAKKIKNLATIGVEWHTQLPEWYAKVEQTNLAKFGETHYSKTAEYKTSVRDSNMEKYGVFHVMHLSDTIDKMQATCLAKYGVTHALASDGVKQKVKDTNMIKYGCENALSNAVIKQKVKDTNLIKYGHAYATQNAAIIANRIHTRLTNYYTPETLQKLNDVEWLTAQHASGNAICSIADSLGVSASNLSKYFNKLNIPVLYHSTSTIQKKLIDYYTNLNIIVSVNDRSIIAPKELDLYFVDYKLAIEVNGCYFHSDKFKSKDYHLEKTQACLDAGITLLQFWDTELNEKWDAIISFINCKLKLSSNIVYARQTKIKILSHKEKHAIIENNHLQGDVNSSINLGLVDADDKIVMIATFGKARYAKCKYELLRLCSLSGLQVVGGASKLLKYFKINYMSNDDILLSYSDRRYSTGGVYNCVGFTFIKTSPPSFFYINKAGGYAGSRYQWQKHLLSVKLPNFIEEASASDNMKAHGYHRVWDCGQLVFEMRK